MREQIEKLIKDKDNEFRLIETGEEQEIELSKKYLEYIAQAICDYLEREDRELREYLWFNHGHIGLYGDDGELQCQECPADFKREPIIDLLKRCCIRKDAITLDEGRIEEILNIWENEGHENVQNRDIAHAIASDKSVIQLKGER